MEKGSGFARDQKIQRARGLKLDRDVSVIEGVVWRTEGGIAVCRTGSSTLTEDIPMIKISYKVHCSDTKHVQAH